MSGAVFLFLVFPQIEEIYNPAYEKDDPDGDQLEFTKIIDSRGKRTNEEIPSQSQKHTARVAFSMVFKSSFIGIILTHNGGRVRIHL